MIRDMHYYCNMMKWQEILGQTQCKDWTPVAFLVKMHIGGVWEDGKSSICFIVLPCTCNQSIVEWCEWCLSFSESLLVICGGVTYVPLFQENRERRRDWWVDNLFHIRHPFWLLRLHYNCPTPTSTYNIIQYHLLIIDIRYRLETLSIIIIW